MLGTLEKNTLNFEVLLLFLSLRYGADLGRSRLVITIFVLNIVLKLYSFEYSVSSVFGRRFMN